MLGTPWTFQVREYRTSMMLANDFQLNCITYLLLLSTRLRHSGDRRVYCMESGTYTYKAKAGLHWYDNTTIIKMRDVFFFYYYYY